MRDMKDSGFVWLGKIPKSWATKKVKQIFFQKKEKAFTDNPTILSLARDGVKIRDISTNEGQLAADYSTYNPVSKNDLLLNPMDLYSGDNCNISRIEGVISPAYVNLRNISQSDTPDFFNYYFKHQYWSMAFFAHGRGVSFENRWTLTNEVLRNYPVLYPSALEQQAIADYLDGECARIDGIVATQRQIIERLKEYKKSVITEAITRGLNPNAPMRNSGIDWIGKIPEHWEISKLKYYSKYITDGTHTTPEYLADGVPFLSIKDISTGKLDFSNTKYISQHQHEELSKHAPIEKGDILFTRIGTLGVSVIVETDITFDIFVSVGLLKPKDNINTKYLNYVMNSEYYYQYIQLVKAGEGTSAAKFNLSDVSNSPIVCPPLSEQQAIADYLDRECARIDTIIEKRERMIELMTEYKKSLIYECVTGKKEVA